MKKMLLLLSTFTLVLLLTACGGSDDSADGTEKKKKAIDISLAHVLPESSSSHQATIKFKELVEKKSDGGIKVNLFPASSLGNERDINENLNSGAIQMIYSSPGATGSAFLPELQVLDAPYLFRDADHATKTAKSPVMEKLVNELADTTNIQILDFWYRAPRHLYTTKDPVNSPEDLKDLKVRVPEITIYFESFAGLGAKVTPVAYAETYGALQQKVVEGLEGPLDLTWGMKFQEVTKYLSLIGWNSGLGPVAVNKDFYNGLTEEYQKIIKESAVEAGEYNLQLTLDGEEELIQNFKEAGLEVIEPDLDAFRAKAKEIVPSIKKVWGGTDIYDVIQEIE